VTVLIRCVRCERGRFGPVQADKVRSELGKWAGWGNRCKHCGTVYPAPPPELCARRRRQRRVRNREMFLEARGQRRLFPR
jgi:hypothetical protein